MQKQQQPRCQTGSVASLAEKSQQSRCQKEQQPRCEKFAAAALSAKPGGTLRGEATIPSQMPGHFLSGQRLVAEIGVPIYRSLDGFQLSTDCYFNLA